MGGSPNDIRISDMRPTLVEPPMYKPKVVLLGKDKKGTVLWALYVSSADTCSPLAAFKRPVARHLGSCRGGVH